MKKTFSKLYAYMGSRKPLFPLALILSALSAIAGLVPFLLMWLIVREVISGGDMTNIKIFDHHRLVVRWLAYSIVLSSIWISVSAVSLPYFF